MPHTEYWIENWIFNPQAPNMGRWGAPRMLGWFPGPGGQALDNSVVALYGWMLGKITRYRWDGDNWQTPRVIACFSILGQC